MRTGTPGSPSRFLYEEKGVLLYRIRGRRLTGPNFWDPVSSLNRLCEANHRDYLHAW